MSGSQVAAYVYGYPDVGLLGLYEMVESVRRITNVTDIPVFADADLSGYSKPHAAVTFDDAFRCIEMTCVWLVLAHLRASAGCSLPEIDYLGRKSELAPVASRRHEFRAGRYSAT